MNHFILRSDQKYLCPNISKVEAHKYSMNSMYSKYSMNSMNLPSPIVASQ